MKRFLIVVFVLAVSGLAVCADSIGENYEGGGTIYGGSGSIFLNLDGVWSVTLDPYVSFLLADDFAAGLGLDTYLKSNGDKGLSLLPSVSFVFGYDPDATTGPAHQVGLRSGLRMRGNSGTEFSLHSGWIEPYYTFRYFIAPRIAPYVQVEAVTLNFVGGITLDTYVRLSFGMSFHVPNKDAVISNARI